jgi:hypothetical protein
VEACVQEPYVLEMFLLISNAVGEHWIFLTSDVMHQKVSNIFYTTRRQQRKKFDINYTFFFLSIYIYFIFIFFLSIYIYFIHFFSVLRSCKIPPKLDSSMTIFAVDICANAIYLHLAMATWIYGNDLFFDSVITFSYFYFSWIFFTKT